MKKHVLVLILLAVGMALQSQVLISILLGDKLNSKGLEFGLVGGLNWTNISGLDTKDYARKWNLGFTSISELKTNGLFTLEYSLNLILVLIIYRIVI